jgi:hypothetical protein
MRHAVATSKMPMMPTVELMAKRTVASPAF